MSSGNRKKNASDQNKSSSNMFGKDHVIFSKNHKISPRQIRRTMTLELFGISSLLLPGYLAGACGILGVAALLIGAGGTILLVRIWDGLWKRSGLQNDVMQENVKAENIDGKKNKSERDIQAESMLSYRIFAAAGGAGLLVISSGVLYMLTILIRSQLLTVRYEPVILITLSVAGVFGLWKGLESRIRVFEVLFWFLMVPLIINLILASVSVSPVYWLKTQISISGFWKSCLLCFLFFSISGLFLLFKPHCSKPELAVKSVQNSILLAVVLNVAIYLILLGIFQDGLLSQLEFPVILLMAVVKLPGEFFERQDALMVGIWFFCLFALFHSMLFYGKELLKGAFGAALVHKEGKTKKEREKDSSCERKVFFYREIRWSIGCGAATFAAAIFLLRADGRIIEPMLYFFPVVGILLLILPFLWFAFFCAGRNR